MKGRRSWERISLRPAGRLWDQHKGRHADTRCSVRGIYWTWAGLYSLRWELPLWSEAISSARKTRTRYSRDDLGLQKLAQPLLSYLFLFSSSAISCLCCLLASKLKLKSVGGRVYSEEKERFVGVCVFFPDSNISRVLDSWYLKKTGF